MEKMTNAELTEALRRLAGISGSYGYNAGETLRAAADRIEQLERERRTILHLWYKCREMCEICAHKCTNVEAESCGECERECLCLVCEGENWEEARDDG